MFFWFCGLFHRGATFSTKNSITSIKNLGDGILCYFDDLIGAIQAAREIDKLSRRSTYAAREISLRYAVTYGKIQKVKLKGRSDIFGTPIDKCARILGIAKPFQILIDDTVFNVADAYFIDNKIKVSEPEVTNLKNYEQLKLREVQNSQRQLLGIKKTQYPPFVRQIICETCGKAITKKQMGFALMNFKSKMIKKAKITLIEDVFTIITKFSWQKICIGIQFFWLINNCAKI